MSDITTRLTELASGIFGDFDTAGATFVHVIDGELAQPVSVGVADTQTGRALDPESLFAIGSVTKGFTSAAIARLVDAGNFKWATPVCEIVPGFKLHDPFATARLTVTDMLSHASGLPRHDLVWYGNSTETRAEVVKRLRYLEPTADLRQAWQYNNLMYITAGHLIEVETGQTWEGFVRAELLDPLTMSRTNFSSTDSIDDANAARPHALKDDVLTPIDWRGLDLAGPAGSINSCASDMGRWLVAQTGGAPEVLTAEHLRQMHITHMHMPQTPQKYPDYRLFGYGLGWMNGVYRGELAVEHGGNIDGFSALVAMLPSKRSAIAVFANGNGSAVPSIVARTFFDLVLGLEPVGWTQRFSDEIGAFKEGFKAASEHRDGAKVSEAPPSHPRDQYNGVFGHDGYGDVTITDTHFELHDLKFELKHKHFDVFEAVMTVPLQGRVPVSFITGTEGHIEALEVQLEPSLDAIRFTRMSSGSVLDADLLERLVGVYMLGSVKLDISLVEGVLHVQVPGQPRFPLSHARDLLFTIPAAPGQSLDFVLDGDGPAPKVVHPGGVFVRSRDE